MKANLLSLNTPTQNAWLPEIVEILKVTGLDEVLNPGNYTFFPWAFPPNVTFAEELHLRYDLTEEETLFVMKEVIPALTWYVAPEGT
jgi:hypothetical protein